MSTSRHRSDEPLIEKYEIVSPESATSKNRRVKKDPIVESCSCMALEDDALIFQQEPIDLYAEESAEWADVASELIWHSRKNTLLGNRDQPALLAKPEDISKQTSKPIKHSPVAPAHSALKFDTSKAPRRGVFSKIKKLASQRKRIKPSALTDPQEEEKKIHVKEQTSHQESQNKEPSVVESILMRCTSTSEDDTIIHAVSPSCSNILDDDESDDENLDDTRPPPFALSSESILPDQPIATTLEAPTYAQMMNQPSSCHRPPSALSLWLSERNLNKFESRLTAMGVKRLADLAYITEDDLDSLNVIDPNQRSLFHIRVDA